MELIVFNDKLNIQITGESLCAVNNKPIKISGFDGIYLGFVNENEEPHGEGNKILIKQLKI